MAPVPGADSLREGGSAGAPPALDMRLFPFTSTRRKATEPAAPPPEWRGSGRAIVVDDQDDVRNLVAHAVERLGFTVDTAGDGPRALACFEADPARVSLAVVDIMLPGMDGLELVRRLRLVRQDIPVVIMSGYFGPEAAARLRAQPSTGFLQKPFKPEALVCEVRSVLGD